MKTLLLILGLLLIGCGQDDSESQSEEAQTDLKPSLWSLDELDLVIGACRNEVYQITGKDGLMRCGCISSEISKKYEFEIYSVNSYEIVEREQALIDECNERYELQEY